MIKFLDKRITMENHCMKEYDKKNGQGGMQMKNHKWWAWATVVCFLMTIYTGYQHK